MGSIAGALPDPSSFISYPSQRNADGTPLRPGSESHRTLISRADAPRALAMGDPEAAVQPPDPLRISTESPPVLWREPASARNGTLGVIVPGVPSTVSPSPR